MVFRPRNLTKKKKIAALPFSYDRYNRDDSVPSFPLSSSFPPFSFYSPLLPSVLLPSFSCSHSCSPLWYTVYARRYFLSLTLSLTLTFTRTHSLFLSLSLVSGQGQGLPKDQQSSFLDGNKNVKERSSDRSAERSSGDVLPTSLNGLGISNSSNSSNNNGNNGNNGSANNGAKSAAQNNGFGVTTATAGTNNGNSGNSGTVNNGNGSSGNKMSGIRARRGSAGVNSSVALLSQTGEGPGFEVRAGQGRACVCVCVCVCECVCVNVCVSVSVHECMVSV